MGRMIDWFTLRDYDKAKAEAVKHIVERQLRGNVLSQDGWKMSREELDAQSREADEAVAYIERELNRAA